MNALASVINNSNSVLLCRALILSKHTFPAFLVVILLFLVQSFPF